MDYTGKIPEVTDTLPFGDDTDKTPWDADFDGEDISYDEWLDEAMRRDLKYDTDKEQHKYEHMYRLVLIDEIEAFKCFLRDRDLTDQYKQYHEEIFGS